MPDLTVEEALLLADDNPVAVATRVLAAEVRRLTAEVERLREASALRPLTALLPHPPSPVWPPLTTPTYVGDVIPNPFESTCG